MPLGGCVSANVGSAVGAAVGATVGAAGGATVGTGVDAEATMARSRQFPAAS